MERRFFISKWFSKNQALKDLPQPQLSFAFGFVILKPPAVSASLKSTTVPRRKFALMASTKTVTPSCAEAKSPSRDSSKTMPYCIPEQPPCSTKTRKFFPAFSGLVKMSFTSAAARGVPFFFQHVLQRRQL